MMKTSRSRPQVPLPALTALTTTLYLATAALLLHATTGETTVRQLAVAILCAVLAGWVDRVRFTRIVTARYARIVALWQEDVTALATGEPRPDLRLLDFDSDDEREASS